MYYVFAAVVIGVTLFLLAKHREADRVLGVCRYCHEQTEPDEDICVPCAGNNSAW